MEGLGLNEMLTAGELKAALTGVPDDAFIGVDVVLDDSAALVGKAFVRSVECSPQDMLGFQSCRVVVGMPYADMVTSKALEHVPASVLEEVAATGKAPTVEEIEDGMYEP